MKLLTRIGLALGLMLIAALALTSTVMGGTDPGTFDPQSLDLGILLTAAGATVAAGIVAAVIQALKRVPVFGTWLENGNEIVLSLVLAAGIIAYAYVAIAVPITMASLAMAFLAWLNLTTVIGKAYDVAPPAIKTALGGQG